MRLRQQKVDAAVFAATVIAIALRLLVQPNVQTRSGGQPPGRQLSVCGASVTNTLSAASVQICDYVTTTTTIGPECPVCPGGIHVVFVQQLWAGAASWMAHESQDVLRTLDTLKEAYEIRVGVVHYNSFGAVTVLPFTDVLDEARGPLSRPDKGFVYSLKIGAAAARALEMLEGERDNTPNAGDPCEIIVFFTSTKLENITQGQATLDAARMIRSDNVELFVGCPEELVDVGCVYARQAVPSRNYSEWNERGRLRRMVENQIDAFTGGLRLRDLFVTQFIDSGLVYVDGSANLTPMRRARTLDNRTRLDWEWKRMTTVQPLTITYRTQPVVEGTWAISGTVKVVDTRSLSRVLPIASQAVTVTGLCLPPTPTPPATETPLSTLAPTATPQLTPTPSSTPTMIPTPTPGPIYLPLLLREQCVPEQRRTDVVLVMDASTSMLEPTAAGGTKLEAAVQAAGVFLDELHLGAGDQAAVVEFNNSATLLAPLTVDRAALEGALAGIGAAQQTCIVCGLEAAVAELASARHVTTSTPAVVLLTDGRSNPRPAEEAVAVAMEAKGRGVVVFTIGLGDELDDEALAAMASPGGYHRAPGAEALAEIYRQVAGAIPCPAEDFWAGPRTR